MKILIVEDDLMSRKLLEAQLCAYGECHLAKNGQEALEAIVMSQSDGKRFDLVCLDIMMPGISGQEVLKHLRNVESELGLPPGEETKVIMTTALKDSANVMAAFKEQCNGYLVKPIKQNKMKAMLKELKLLPE